MLDLSWSAASMTSKFKVKIFPTSIIQNCTPEFLACIHLHTNEEDLGEISKMKTIRMVPLLCGLASRDKSDSQKITSKIVRELGSEDAELRNTEDYLRYLQGMYLG